MYSRSKGHFHSYKFPWKGAREFIFAYVCYNSDCIPTRKFKLPWLHFSNLLHLEFQSLSSVGLFHFHHLQSNICLNRQKWQQPWEMSLKLSCFNPGRSSHAHCCLLWHSGQQNKLGQRRLSAFCDQTTKNKINSSWGEHRRCNILTFIKHPLQCLTNCLNQIGLDRSIVRWLES